MNREERFYERVVLIAVMIAAIFLYMTAAMTTTNFSVEGELASMDIPKYVLLAIIGLSGVCLFGKIWAGRRGGKYRSDEKEKLTVDKKVLFSAAGIFVYTLSWKIVGFACSSVLFFLYESWVLGEKIRIKQAAILAVVYVALIYVIFGFFFNVEFPEPILEMIAG